MTRSGVKVKCVVWDLDNTLWNGILAEGDSVAVRSEARIAIKALDERGILQSIASRNDFDAAMSRLRDEGLEEYFLYPQINWSLKSESISNIVKDLNIGIDSIAFLDDQAFERDEVASVHPEVRVYDAPAVAQLTAMDEFIPEFVTEDSRNRRAMYRAEAHRKDAKHAFKGPEEAFLRSLGMKLSMSLAHESDLPRAEELTLRTNQLNTTGITYSIDELRVLISDPGYRVIMVDLMDRYGDYGKIGLVLLSMGKSAWTIELLLMSCRVMSRGVGGVIINLLRKECARRGISLRTRFRDTGRNRMMYVTYRFAGFREMDGSSDEGLLENDLSAIPSLPDYVQLNLAPALGWFEDDICPESGMCSAGTPDVSNITRAESVWPSSARSVSCRDVCEA